MHASGVIAVVVAGLLSNTQHNRYVAALPELRGLFLNGRGI